MICAEFVPKHLEKALDMARHILGATEHIHQINRTGHIGQPPIDRMPEDLGDFRVVHRHRHHVEADAGHHHDAALGSRRDVDIVDADAGAADDLEVGRSSNQLFRRLGGGTDGETIIIADDFGELFLVLAELRLEIHFNAAITEDLDGGFRQFVGYENARCHDEASFREFV